MENLNIRMNDAETIIPELKDTSCEDAEAVRKLEDELSKAKKNSQRIDNIKVKHKSYWSS